MRHNPRMAAAGRRLAAGMVAIAIAVGLGLGLGAPQALADGWTRH